MPHVCGERAQRITNFYHRYAAEHSTPVLRALAFKDLCANKAVYIGDLELIVGERGASPKATPTFPEISCHSVGDLEVLRSREKTRYGVSDDLIELYQRELIPFWQGKSLRDRAFEALPSEWQAAYKAGIFTEFLEQRAPGHTVLGDKVYRKGCIQIKNDIAVRISRIDLATDVSAKARLDQLLAMAIACDGILILAARYAEKAQALALQASDHRRRHELEHISAICRRVPAHAPSSFWEALQMYWFVHLGVVFELNGWDAFSPGHLDHHLVPFYRTDIARGTLTREQAKELISCLWIKFNNQPAPPKVGVTAAESSTYNDFVNINLGGVRPDGTDGANEVSQLILEVVDTLPLLQPGTNIQVSRATSDNFLEAACGVIQKGYGFPSVFNADGVVAQMLGMGKTLADARTGGTSGCVETGCFGKEAYILTGYLNLPKILELALRNGVDPISKQRIGIETGHPSTLTTFDACMRAFDRQLCHFVDIKMAGNHIFERLYASDMPAPFLSTVIDDCIENATDYNAGGARYNTRYIQGVGIGTITDSLMAIKTNVYDEKQVSLSGLCSAMDADFKTDPLLQARLCHATGHYGTDDDAVDAIMRDVFHRFLNAVDGRPARLGGIYHVAMLPTTCHIYFGSVCAASADGRLAGEPLSEGISPVQGRDTNGPTAVLTSASKMDHEKTGGTLLNLKLMPKVVAGEAGIKRLCQLIRAYFELGGHHIQFNVVDEQTLRRAQENPDAHRSLLVRVAGYSDYFCDISAELQEEIISRTAHG